MRWLPIMGTRLENGDAARRGETQQAPLSLECISSGLPFPEMTMRQPTAPAARSLNAKYDDPRLENPQANIIRLDMAGSGTDESAETAIEEEEDVGRRGERGGGGCRLPRRFRLV